MLRCTLRAAQVLQARMRCQFNNSPTFGLRMVYGRETISELVGEPPFCTTQHIAAPVDHTLTTDIDHPLDCKHISAPQTTSS